LNINFPKEIEPAEREDPTAPRNVGEKPGVLVKTFGCQMNQYDSEKMVSLLAEDYTSVEQLELAELVIVNTCSVREKGEHKLFSLLGSLRELKKERPELVIGVAGCVAQQEGQAIMAREGAVDFVVGTHNLSLVPALARSARNGVKGQVAVDYRDEWEDLPEEEQGTSIGVRALIAIQRGCNKSCAFCVVPTTRGPEVSRSAAEIERELRLKVRLGAKEVLLLGQTVNSYGRDLKPRFPFEKLVERLAAIPGLERIRFTSPHPQEVRPEFIELYGSVPQLMPHIHLPVQSGSDRILKLMNRNYRINRYFEIVDALRQRLPDIAITTDFIVGFPTESEEDFELSLSAIRQVGYNQSYSFKFSIRPNTMAKVRFTAAEEVPDAVAHDRLTRLQQLQEELSQEFNSQLLGSTVEVLVEGMSKNISSLAKGRTRHNIQTEIMGDVKVGDVVLAKVEFASPYGLRAALINKI